MKKTGVVKNISNNWVIISIFKESACAHCSNCSESKKIDTEIKIKNNEDLSIGDVVTFEMEDNIVLQAALIVYIVPIIFFFLGYFIGSKVLHLKESFCILASFISLILSFVGINIYDRTSGKKKFQEDIKITSVKKHGGN
ncbi:SoxR reducing system RseC family protein [Cetobacterium sp. SF1]|uniref:SoxR reducing system RseC family protein n=1 Tax=unclassified Cetobacterium TaxID=2630983 RepID=UPI003CF212D4